MTMSDALHENPAATESGTPAMALARFATALTAEKLPEHVRERAKLHILDAIGVGIAARSYPFAEAAIAAAQAFEDTGRFTVIGRQERLALRDAALVNGILIHGLDFDDTHLTSIVHPSAACLPCALTMAEAVDASGSELLAAYGAGMEVAIRIGAAVKGGFHHAGFHGTGVVAHFSSAVAAAKLLGLTADQVVAAQGIVASTAAGVQVFLEEGAWTKRLHPGWAAVAGITAARLAQMGFRGPTRPYEGKFGFFETHLHGPDDSADLELITSDLGTLWNLADTAIKPYPVCHFIHGCADAAIALHQEIDGAEIVDVEALLPADTMPIIAEPLAAKQRASTEYEAKFSAPFVVAMCLLRGRFGLPELQPDALAEPEVRALAQKVTCSTDDNSAFPTYFSGGVRVTTADGRTLHRHVRVNSGAGERALDLAGVTEKFLASASLSMSDAEAMRVREAVLNLENISVRELTDSLRPQ